MSKPFLPRETAAFKHFCGECHELSLLMLTMLAGEDQASGQQELMRKLIHRTKGAAGLFGFLELSQTAAELENALERRIPLEDLSNDAKSFVRQLSQVVDKVKAHES